MFRHLKTKLTLAYGGLLGLILLAVAGLVLVSVARSARVNVGAELQATASVYERLWQVNEAQLADNADLMSRDFGFREAVATRDSETVASALENLRNRLGLARAFLVFEDGSALEAGQSRSLTTPSEVMDAVLADDRASGLLAISGVQYQAVSAPVSAGLSSHPASIRTSCTNLRAFRQLIFPRPLCPQTRRATSSCRLSRTG